MTSTPQPVLRKLSTSEVLGQYPGLYAKAVMSWALPQVDSHVIAAHRLARGALFYASEGVEQPFAFLDTVAGRRTHIVVAREYGDVAWPAWLAKQRSEARGLATAWVRAGMSDVRQAIDRSRKRLAWLARDRDLLDEHGKQMYDRALAGTL